MAPIDATGSDPASPPTPGLDAPRARDAAPGEEPLAADLATQTPRVSTRALVWAVGVIAVLVLVSGVVALVVLHQPRLTPVPVPSVSSIA